MACTIRRVKNLVVEDGEVQGETKADGVSRGEVGLGNVGGVLLTELMIITEARFDGNMKRKRNN